MARKLLLSYDASLDWHYDGDSDFRKNLIEFLFKEKDAKALESHVSSTILITVDNNNVDIKQWSEDIKAKFGKHFKFIIVLVDIIVVTEKGKEVKKHGYNGKSSNTINQNFAKLVAKFNDV